MPRPTIVELTNEEIIRRNTDKVFRPVSETTPPIPASYDGKFALLAAIAVNVQLSEAQMDQLENAIEAIAGVHKAFVMIGPYRLPLDRVPVGSELRIRAEAGFTIEEIPTP